MGVVSRPEPCYSVDNLHPVRPEKGSLDVCALEDKLAQDDTHQRYLRTKALPANRQTAATVAWVQGYEAGWANAADRWMTTPAEYPGEDDTTTWLTDEDAA